MELRNIGSSGLRTSVVGLGCNNFGGDRLGLEATRAIVEKALDCGITFFDTADRYTSGESETLLGLTLGPRRKDIVLATKFGYDVYNRGIVAGGSRRHVMKAVEDSLRRLKTDWIDLYQIHTPDPDTPIGETLRAVDDLIRDGKVRYFGLSNFAAWQVVDAIWTARSLRTSGCISVQSEYSLAHREHEKALIPATGTYGLGFIPYRPMASGVLSGKYRRGAPPTPDTRTAHSKRRAPKYLTERNFDLVARLQAFADARGWRLSQVAIAWLANRPPVSSVIAGATRPEQIEDNVAALELRLSVDDIAELDRISETT